MSRKSLIHSYKFFDSQAVSADATSSSTTVDQLDYCSIDFSWSASTLAATLYVQVKNGSKGNWRSLDFGSTISISGTSGSHEIQINSLPFTDLRLFVDHSSGSGTVNAVITSKSMGA